MFGFNKKKKEDIRAKIEAGALVVDVRSPGEFSGGHYPGAINIPVSDIAGRISEFGATDRAIILYCASGMRSGAARGMLVSRGYTDVTNAGGISSMPS